MAWSTSQRTRLSLEKDILEKFFKDKVEWLEPTGETKVEQTLESNSDTKYKLRVYLPKDFPNSCPHMAVVFPEQLRTKDGKRLPLLDNHFHTLGLTVDGFTKLCHYSPELWTPDNTLYQVLMKGRLWIEAYEGHLETGDLMDVYLKHQTSTEVGNDSSSSNEAYADAEDERPAPAASEQTSRCAIS